MSMIPIVRISGNGEGVTADGKHVPLAAPGDAIDDFGAIVPGVHHQAPPCRHYPRCGGCQLQHVDDAGIAAFLVDRIAGALAGQGFGDGGMAMPAIAAPWLSPPRTRRRAAMKAERIGRAVVIGYHEAQSHAIVDMHECHVLAPELFALVAPLRGLLAQLLPPRKGSASVQMTVTDQGVDLLLGKVRADGLAATEALTAFAATHALARLSIDMGDGAEPRWEPQPATVTLGGVAVPLPAGGFLQATADGEAALVAAVRDAVGPAAMVADLFAGLGTFALPLSTGAKVYAGEGDRAAAMALKGAAALARRPVFVEHRDLYRRPLTAAELGRFDAVVLDPPRAGAREQVTELAAVPAGAATRRIAYVSCNPATFARDARILVAAGWRLETIRPVGQFRWSTHIELAAGFGR